MTPVQSEGHSGDPFDGLPLLALRAVRLTGRRIRCCAPA
jgi:hypothetical protein